MLYSKRLHEKDQKSTSSVSEKRRMEEPSGQLISRTNIKGRAPFLVYNTVQHGDDRRGSWKTPNNIQNRASASFLMWSKLPFSAESKPHGFGSMKVMQSRVRISKKGYRKQARNGHTSCHSEMEQRREAQWESNYFLKLKTLYRHIQWFSFGREKAKRTESTKPLKTRSILVSI